MQTLPGSRRFVAACGLLLLSAPLQAAAVIIDFAAVRAVDSYTQATMDEVAQASFYFEHASVGGNMVSGLNALHTANPSFYRLTTVHEDSRPPASIGAGTVYDYDRGNPGWAGKVSGFAADLNGGWGGKTTFALNKFCYIDPDVDWATYRDSMLALEAIHRGTTLVYMTIPLTTGGGSDNIARNVFNATLREWAAANNKVLFDIADIEAHATDGTLQTFSSNGETYARLAGDWSADGGHLNTAGQALVARGFYALAAETASIPEPATSAVLLGLGVAGVLIWRRRR